jgi:hypothetical protein
MVRTVALIAVLVVAGAVPGGEPLERAPAPRAVDPLAALRKKMPEQWHKYLVERLAQLDLTDDEISKTDDGDLARLAKERMDFVDDVVAGTNWAAYKKEAGASPITRGEVLAALPRPWRAVYSARYLDSQTFNGGIHQFFWNSRGGFNATLVADLRYLGGEKHAELLAEALKLCTGAEEGTRAGAADVKDLFERFADSSKTNPYQR